MQCTTTICLFLMHTVVTSCAVRIYLCSTYSITCENSQNPRAVVSMHREWKSFVCVSYQYYRDPYHIIVAM